MHRDPPSRSIRRQLTIQILAGTLILLVIAGLILLGAIFQRLVQSFDQILAAEAGMLIRNAERKGRTILWDLPDTYSAGSHRNADPVYCQMFLKDGTVVGLSQTLGMDNLPRHDARAHSVWNARLPDGRRGRHLQTTFHPQVDDLDTQVMPDDPHEQTFEIPVTMEPAGVELVLVVARSREPLDALVASLYLAVIAVAVTLACALAWLVRRAITRALLPIEEINSQISMIAPDALNKRLQISAPPVELAAIEATVNRLLDRVEQAFQRERRFSNDLAHELRTPIAELRMACEVGARWPDDPQSTRQFFQDGQAIALHLEKIVSSLLTLSRCEGVNTFLQTRPIQVQPFVRECWQHTAAFAAEKRMNFDEHIAPEMTVESDSDMLEIVLRNLLENAIAHGEPGTVVECHGSAAAAGIELRVVNSTRGLRSPDLAHIFDRFWRKEESRTERRHVGLGLSIAKALCEMLGLRLRVELLEERLFEAIILIPNAVLRKP